MPTQFALRGDRFKLIEYHGIWDTDELYDSAVRSQETTNLIRDPAYKTPSAKCATASTTRSTKPAACKCP